MIYGLDLSLTSSGVAILDSDIQTERVLVKKKLNRFGKLQVTERGRLHQISTRFDEIFTKYGEPELIVIEEPFISPYPNVNFQIRCAHGTVISRIGAAGFECPMLYVHPTTLKNLVTGNGRAEKKDMQAAIERVTGELYQHDVADAVALAIVGRAVGDIKVDCRKCKGRGEVLWGESVVECSACEGDGIGVLDLVNLRELLNPNNEKEPTNLKLLDLIYREFGMTLEGVKETKRLARNAKACEDRKEAKVLKMKSTKDVAE